LTNLKALRSTIEGMRSRFTDLLTWHTADGLEREVYCRYLSMQFHLTKDVQRYFLFAAGNRDFAKLRRLRKFLVDFANEEELHYQLARSDLVALGEAPSPEPFDVELWHAYFSTIVLTRPFVRLGAASVLENLSDPLNRPQIRALLRAPFLSEANTKFLVLHMHEVLPHGDQILDALEREDLTAAQSDDLIEGAKKGGVLYLRMAEWALSVDALSHAADEETKPARPKVVAACSA
jgi:hypothetical protein